MKNKRKIIALIAIVSILISTVGMISVSANSSVPYGDKGASISWFKTSATAYITKCSCSPVDNHLMVWIKVQYEDDGQYLWNPANGSLYFDEGTNVAEARKKVSGSGIVHAEGFHFGRCGNGNEIRYDFSVDK